MVSAGKIYPSNNFWYGVLYAVSTNAGNWKLPSLPDTLFSMPPFIKQRGVEVCFNHQASIGGVLRTWFSADLNFASPGESDPGRTILDHLRLTARSQPLGVEPLFDRFCKRCKQRNNGNAGYHVLRHELWLDEKLNCPKQIFHYSPLFLL